MGVPLLSTGCKTADQGDENCEVCRDVAGTTGTVECTACEPGYVLDDSLSPNCVIETSVTNGKSFSIMPPNALENKPKCGMNCDIIT